MSDSDETSESDSGSLCYSADASGHSEAPPILSDDDMRNSSDESWPSSPTISNSGDSDSNMMDSYENDGDVDDSSTTSDMSIPLDETMNEIDDISEDDGDVVSLTDGISDGDDIVELSDSDDIVELSESDDIVELSEGDDIVELGKGDIADPKEDTVARSQPPTTSNKSMFSASTCKEEEIVARPNPSTWSTCYKPMSILSAFSSTSSKCAEEKIVTASCSRESNVEENHPPSSSIKNFLPPNPNTHKLCFDNGLEVDRILEVVCHNKEILFRVRWRKDKNGGTDYVNAFEIYHKCPNMALQFYKERFKDKIIDMGDKKT